MKYNFDEEINRYGTDSVKYDLAKEEGYPEDVLPLWVADMDFSTAPEVIDALKARAEHGIFGYTCTKRDYFDAVNKWFASRLGWSPEEEWLILTPGVVFAIAASIRALTKPGNAVLIQEPVYYPFRAKAEENGRRVVNNELLNRNGHYEIDFEDLESKFKNEDVRMMIFCSPHNPVGRVWTKEELTRIAELCVRYNVILVSDEIHCDFTWEDHPFVSMAAIDLNQLVICTAPSKTFNLAGLETSNIFIPNEELRLKFKRELSAIGSGTPNTLGLTACKAAYEKGAEWLDELKIYLKDNLNFLREYLSENLSQIKLIEPEGTYFAWLDFSALGLSKDELNDIIINRAKLWLDAGHIFGKNSAQYQRVVLACRRKTLARALDQLAEAVSNLNCTSKNLDVLS